MAPATPVLAQGDPPSNPEQIILFFRNLLLEINQLLTETGTSSSYPRVREFPDELGEFKIENVKGQTTLTIQALLNPLILSTGRKLTHISITYDQNQSSIVISILDTLTSDINVQITAETNSSIFLQLGQEITDAILSKIAKIKLRLGVNNTNPSATPEPSDEREQSSAVQVILTRITYSFKRFWVQFSP
ncbi:MAG: hypothetical protein UT36_C0001G0193 [Candidatus Peregrinibacteria bacterium GW2011_GWF2_39_17]|nr:MAG: hypothetical protein UT36_C0001G0193 [Candidatus Peregrinibacteria bacterium GW2011_GWF2_39_17]HCW32631.1 hypothetical protein [Candidatus Peregrinibacteria bacterium]